VEKKKIAVASVAAVALLGLGLLVRKIDAPQSNGEARPASSASNASTEAPSGTSQTSTASSWDGAALAATVRDAKVREEVRRKIMEAFVARNGATDPPPTQPLTQWEPMPVKPDGKIDGSYIQERVRDDFFPMGKQCYEELLARDPKAGGKIVVNMTIVGDEKVGGVVDEATIDDKTTTLKDEKLATCFRESMMSMAFRPPPHGGTVTVVYPFTLLPYEPDGGEPE
jgi:hypothetical protein